MEYIEGVYDGSEKTKAEGYNLVVGALVSKEEVKPLFGKTFSTKAKAYKSKFSQVKEHLDEMIKQSNTKITSTIVTDRGFDDQKY